MRVTPHEDANDKSVIRRYIKANLPKIQDCYERELRLQPTLAGKVTTHFAIAPDGSVKDASATGVSPKVATCVASVIKANQFPKPTSGIVEVNYPFVFQRAGAGSAIAPVVATEPPKPADPVVVRSVFAPIGVTDDVPASTTTPLATERGVRRLLRGQPRTLRHRGPRARLRCPPARPRTGSPIP